MTETGRVVPQRPPAPRQSVGRSSAPSGSVHDLPQTHPCSPAATSGTSRARSLVDVESRRPLLDVRTEEPFVPADRDRGKRLVPAAGVVVHARPRNGEQRGDLVRREKRLVECDDRRSRGRGGFRHVLTGAAGTAGRHRAGAGRRPETVTQSAGTSVVSSKGEAPGDAPPGLHFATAPPSPPHRAVHCAGKTAMKTYS